MTQDANVQRSDTEERLRQEIRALRSQALYRHLEPVDRAASTVFCSNDYLGLSKHAALARALTAAIEATGRVAATGSRLLSGHVQAWERLETGFAAWVGAEASLFFGSGYAANVGLLTAVVGEQDTVYSDSANHASLIDGIRLAGCRKVIFSHLDLDFLEDSLRHDSGTERERFIVVESIFSMDGDRAPIQDLCSLAERYGAGLIVDEAHATGVTGPFGRGLVSASIRASGALIATVNTCGKALASAGAFVTGSATLKEFLVNRSRTFIFSTALPPYMAAQAAAAIKLAAGADEQRAQLEAKSNLLRQRLDAAGFHTGESDSQIVPVLLGTNENALRAAATLEAAGFVVRAIRWPTVPEGTARLRLSITTEITNESIHGLVDTLIGLREAAAK